MFWRRLRSLPRPLQVVVIVVPVLLLAGGAAFAISRLPRGGGGTAGGSTPSASVSASECPTPCPSECPSPGCSPSPSSSASASSTSSGPAAAPSSNPGCVSVGGSPPSGSISANFPTALAFAPDGRLFWTERAGTVKVWQNGTAHVFASVATVTTEQGGGYSERGLLGLALSPSFVQDHFVYAFYSLTDYAHQRVVRWTDCGGNGTAQTTIVDNLPAGGDCCHKGGRIAFGPGGFLFVTLGENHVPSAAQDKCDLRGKVLRYSADGSPAGQCGAVYTSGLRNPFGIAFGPDGTLAVTNNGPSSDAGTPCGSCGDMVDIVGTSAGVDYQWPNCWGYSHSINGASCAGLQAPNYSTEGGPFARSNPFFVAPTGMTYANGHFLFCADIGNGDVYQYNGQNSVSDTGIGNCLLDVKQAPDGALYTAGGSSITRH